jgi:hypothetical protein
MKIENTNALVGKDYCLSFCPFSFGHSIVYPSLNYEPQLPLSSNSSLKR